MKNKKETENKNGESVIKCPDADKANAIYFYSYDSRSVLYSKNEKKLIPPASTVKIMTGLIACEKLAKRLDEYLVITDDMLKGHTGSSMGLKVGMTVSVTDLLYGALCGGGNDSVLTHTGNARIAQKFADKSRLEQVVCGGEICYLFVLYFFNKLFVIGKKCHNQAPFIFLYFILSYAFGIVNAAFCAKM